MLLVFEEIVFQNSVHMAQKCLPFFPQTLENKKTQLFFMACYPWGPLRTAHVSCQSHQKQWLHPIQFSKLCTGADALHKELCKTKFLECLYFQVIISLLQSSAAVLYIA